MVRLIKKFRQRLRGQSLFEVVVAIAIISVVLVALISVATISVRNTSFSRNKTLASRISQETVEWLRGERDSSWDNFFTNVSTASNWCFVDLSWATAKIGTCSDSDKVAGSIFKREIRFSILDASTVQAEAVVFWDDPQGYHEVKVSTIFTDWQKN